MPGPRGRAPTSSATLAPSKARLGVVVDVDPGEQREGAVVELHRRALGGLDRVGDLEQAQLRPAVSGPSIWPRGDPEQHRVADLAGGAGDGDLDGMSLTRGSHLLELSALTPSPLQVLVDRGEELLRGLELLVAADEQRQVLGHLPALDRLDADALERLGELARPPGVASIRPRAASARVQAKIEAIGLVEVGLPFWCSR